MPGTAVCLIGGGVAAVLERGGEVLRLFDMARAGEILRALADDYRRGRVFREQKRLRLREGTQGLEAELSAAGFYPDALEWALWPEGDR